MKIIFPLLWIAEHSGDNAIWTKLIKTIEEVFPDSEYICPTQYPPTSELLEWDIEQLKKVTDKITVIPMGLVTGFDYQEFKKLKTREEVVSYMDKVQPNEYLADADMIISMGGGYMFDDALYCLYLPPFYVAQRLGKPTFFNTQTFSGSGFAEATKMLGNLVFNKAKYLSPREQESLHNLRNTFGANNELVLSQDFTFDMPTEPYDKPLPENAVKINIRQDKVDTHSIEVIAQVADMITETMGKVVFVPICHGGDRDDRVAHSKIASMMKHECVQIVDKLTVGQAKEIAKGGIFITDRYHTCIFSASVNTPFVPLMPDIGFKMKGLLDALKYPPVSILDLQKTTVKDLYRNVLEVWSNRESIKAHLEKVVPEVKTHVTETTSKLKEALKNG